jgi:hypothetical protein
MSEFNGIFKAGDKVKIKGSDYVYELKPSARGYSSINDYPLEIHFGSSVFALFTVEGILCGKDIYCLEFVSRPKQKVKKKMYQIINKANENEAIYVSSATHASIEDYLKFVGRKREDFEILQLGPCHEIEVEE